MHDPNGAHPYGQHAMVIAPPVDVLSGVLPLLPSEGNLQIFADWDQYSEMPRANGVFYRPGWMYYPWVCAVSGEVGWSPRVGESSYSFLGEDAICHPNRASASANVDVPVPPDAEQVRFVYEIWASCDQFGLPEEDCSGETNETPLIDNIRVRFTVVPNAPIVNFDTGTNFQDGFAHGTNVNDPTKPGRADVARNLSFGNALPYVLGDSLAIRGPAPTGANTRWEARLWYRVSRVGPGANANYVVWRDRVADGKAMDPELAGSGNPIEFTFGFMDSTQVGTSAFRNRFCSYFREDDDDFDVGSPELSDGNEMIADDVLFPGTRIEYFISANYLVEPSQYFLLPDTSGGYFDEFEILPSWRDDEGVWKYPCFLQIDAYNQVTDEFMAEALALAGIESDRFDHRDACACWAAPMNRGLDPANTNGMTLPQLLGYRGVLVNVGLRGEFWPEDYQLFGDYLTAGICGTDRRGFILNGTRSTDPYWDNAFVEQRLGVGLVDDDYRGFSGDENYCVQIAEPAGGGVPYGTSHSGGNYSYSAFGSGCPDPHGYDVFVPLGTAIGNRVYVNETNGAETGFAQIVNEGTSPHNYRSVVDATSWPYLAGQGATGECLTDGASRVEAISNEVRAAVEWIYGAADLPTLCEDPCGDEVTQVDPDGRVAPVATRLEVGAPNPFSPRTTLRYTLGAQGPVDLAIFDVGGRRVRTLASGERTAGSHEVVWDGRDDSGGRVASGTYWARLQAAGRRSASRLVVLR